MPILSASNSSDCDVVSSSCCSTTLSVSDDDDTATAGSRGQVTTPPQRPPPFITQIPELDDEFEEREKVAANAPKKRGPKKKRMTPARIAKLKQRRLKVSNQPNARYSCHNSELMYSEKFWFSCNLHIRPTG